MAMAMAMALHPAAASLVCSSPLLAPLRHAGPVSCAALHAAAVSLGSAREARSACFKRFAKFQQFSQESADGSAVEERAEADVEESDADQYVHIEFSPLYTWPNCACEIVLIRNLSESLS